MGIVEAVMRGRLGCERNEVGSVRVYDSGEAEGLAVFAEEVEGKARKHIAFRIGRHVEGSRRSIPPLAIVLFRKCLWQDLP